MSMMHNPVWQLTPHCWHEEEKDGSLTGGKHFTKKRECCLCGREQVWTWQAVPISGHGPYVKTKSELQWVTIAYPGSWY